MQSQTGNGGGSLTDAGAHPELSQELFDTITRELYRAAAGAESWLTPLNRVVAVLGLAAIHFYGVDKRVGSMSFSYEAGNGPPEWGLDYIRTYQHIDPRLEVALLLQPMQWMACHEHFDDTFVAKSSFYQDFLIPYGARYLFGCKLMDDESRMVFLGMLVPDGKPPLNMIQRQFVEHLGLHVAWALALQDHLRRTSERSVVGFELLSRMRQPILVLDADRNINFRNASAQMILDGRDLFMDQAGVLVCCDAPSSVALTVTMRDLGLAPINANVGDVAHRADRRSVKLRRETTHEIVVVTLLALRPESTASAFGPAPQALVTIYEPGRMAEPDLFLLAATFDLTPAESRLASRLCAGATTQDIAEEFHVSANTIKSQLKSIFAKTGTNRQSDLVRLLITASTF